MKTNNILQCLFQKMRRSLQHHIGYQKCIINQLALDLKLQANVVV